MKKILAFLVISFLFSNPTLSNEDFPKYSSRSLDENLIKYNWKIDKVRHTSDTDIYYLKNNKRLLNCIVFLEFGYIDTECSAP